MEITAVVLEWTELFHWAKWNKGPDVSISYDAAGTIGFRAINQDTWFASLWPSDAWCINIAVKEFSPIVIEAHNWGILGGMGELHLSATT